MCPLEKTPGVLYIVSTPIGNLEDITLRALRVLKGADLVAAEDTRHTGNLLRHFGIETPLCSFYSHNQDRRVPEIVARLLDGRSVALVADAGTPGISDPAVSLVRASIDAGITVVPIPGPAALVAALVASGLDTHEFTFIGFLPAKPGRRRRALEALAAEPRTVVLYESPHRIQKVLVELAETFGERPAALGRELTKLHEEFERGTLAELAARYAEKKPRGEYVIVIAGKTH
jgi:16S rRNA (cytidine1402-2'-O)-methyltransferase